MSLTRLTTSLDSARDDIRGAIGAAAQRTGVDFSYLLAQAKSESGLNPTAKASASSATGLYQFLDQSWLAIVKRHGTEHGMGWASDAISARPGGGFKVDPAYRESVMALREQAGPAALMAASYAADNATGLSATLGRQANSTDLYFAHFLGLAGAKRFLGAAQNAPDANAASLFPREARANRGIFFDRDGSARSLSEVYQLMGDKLARAGASEGSISPSYPPGSPSPTPPQPSVQYASLTDADMAGANGDESDGGDVMSALAAMGQNRIDVLKPTPAQAKLAYLMLSTPMA